MDPLKKFLENEEYQRQEYLRDLENRSKTLSDLLILEEFNVDGVLGENYATTFTTYSEAKLGGAPLIYRGGFTSRLHLNVTPINEDLPIESLTFNGTSIVKAGDHITALIPKYKEEKIKFGFYVHILDPERKFYLERNFEPHESAIELNIFSELKEILRTDRSIDYRKLTGSNN